MPLNPQRTIDELKELRELTGDADGAQRVAWTDTWAKARAWFKDKLADLPVEYETDEAGNVWVAGPGGIWVFDREGKHLGTIIAPMHPHNMAWGDADHQTLYLTAKTGLYKLRLSVKGAGIPK